MYLSMTQSLSNKCARNNYNWTLTVQVIGEDVTYVFANNLNSKYRWIFFPRDLFETQTI